MTWIKDIVQFLPIFKMLYYLLIQKVTLSSAEAEVAFGLLWYTCNPDTWEYNSKSSFFLIRCHFEFIFEILFSFSRVTAAPSRCLPFLRGKTGDCDTHTCVAVSVEANNLEFVHWRATIINYYRVYHYMYKKPRI